MRGVWLFLALTGCALAGAPKPRRSSPADRADAVQIPIRTVVVHAIEDRAGALEAAEREQLSAFFRAQLDQRAWFRVVQDDAAKEQLKAEKRAALRPGRDEASRIALGQTLSASHLVRTELLRLGERCTLTTALYDIETEARVDTGSEDISCTVDAARDAVGRLSGALGAPVVFVPDGRWRMTAKTLLGTDSYELSLVSTGVDVLGTGADGARWEGVLTGKVLEAVWMRGGFAGRVVVRFARDGKMCAGTYGLGEEDAAFEIVGVKLD